MRLPRLDWIDRDGKLLILAGCVSAVFSGSFSPRDVGEFPFQMALVLLVGGIGGVCATLIVVVFAEKIGRRRLLVALTLASAAVAAAFALTSGFLILLLFALLRALSLSDIGRALLQASMSDTAPPNRRTDLYAIYHIAKDLAYIPLILISGLFAFFSALPGLNEAFLDVAPVTASVLLLLAAAFLYSRVSPGVEVPVEKRKPINPFKLPSRRVIFTLAGLLGLNTLAATLLYHSVDFYSSISWSEEGRSGKAFTYLTAASLSAVFSIPVLWLAAKIANRFGLVKILALIQIAAPLFIIPVAFILPGGLSALFLTIFFVLRGMSVPLRASYTMGVVAPEERVTAAGIIILGMAASEAVTPVFGGVFADTDRIIIPIFIGGFLAVAANLALYRMFRNVKPPEETAPESVA